MIMKLVLIFVMGCFNLMQIIETKLYRLLVDDNILPYNIDSSVPSYKEFFSVDNLILEQIDDENVQIGGYVTVIKPMNRKMPLIANVRTQTFEKATWNEGAYRLTLPSLCMEFLDPTRPWYNVTKLWTSDVCPAAVGDVWRIESNKMNILFDVPPTMQAVPWRAYIMVTQGFPGFETYKFGLGIELRFLSI